MANTITQSGKCFGKGLKIVFMWTPANLGILRIEMEDKYMKPKRNVVESEVKGSKSRGGLRANGVGNRR